MTNSVGTTSSHAVLSFAGRVYAIVVILWGLIGLLLLMAFSIPLFSVEGFVLFIFPAVLGGLFGILSWNEHALLYSKA